MIKKRYEEKKCNEINKFYHQVASTMDTYLTKVIFCRILHVMANAILFSGEMLLKYDNDQSICAVHMEEHFLKLFHLNDHFEIFLLTLVRYNSHFPLTLNQKTIQDMINITIYVRSQLNYHIFEANDYSQTVSTIRKHLFDKRFHRDENDLTFFRTNIIDFKELLDELKEINTYLIHMVEAKMIV